MKAFFSKRHEEALFDTLKPSFSVRCRVSIERVLDDHSEHGNYIDERGKQYNDANITYLEAEEDLKTFYGTNTLYAYDDDNKRARASFSDFIRGGYPQEVLDAIEAWFYKNPKKARECEKELNDIFSIHSSLWRVVNGEAVLVDSDYLYQEVRAKAISLLSEGKAYGALEEFQDAIDDLTSGDTKDAVIKAHKSVESTMKTILGTSEHLTFGQLLKKLIKSDIIPEYYENFLKHFEQVALGAVKERNLPGRGHGQGQITTDVPRSLAEFAVNLAGSINVFIIKHGIEVQSESANEEDELEPDDIPF